MKLMAGSDIPKGDGYTNGDPVLSRRGDFDFDDFDEEY